MGNYKDHKRQTYPSEQLFPSTENINKTMIVQQNMKQADILQRLGPAIRLKLHTCTV